MLDKNLTIFVTTSASETLPAEIEIVYRNTVIVGSGVAALNAIDWLQDLKQRDCVLVTEDMNNGTSRNAGSDKQTYYKLSIGPGEPDSVADVARALFEGKGVDGKIALTEAANSVRCFMKLVNLGVEFPTDSYGQFVGYKTDHDVCQRGTSAGPLTSKYMTEALERSIKTKDTEIRDGLLAFRILTSADGVSGVVCLDTLAAGEERLKLVVFACSNVIWCSGGPASIYETVVYPENQTGMSGAPLQAGAEGVNLQDWQYGLASVGFRWNVSGTYQQVLPRYVAIDAQGKEREFLTDYGMSPIEAVDTVFYKGYQWPFDIRKCDKSSRIDLAVYEETIIKRNHVYLDFRKNPLGIKHGFSKLSDEAREYLDRSDALFGTPYDRLERMNPLAVKLFRDHDIDLKYEMLEIAMCAQHCNGGIRVDANWQSCVRGLYVAGEAAGTFGAYRPGGSALNSTQVGSMRAAQHIILSDEGLPMTERNVGFDPIEQARKIAKTLALRITGTDANHSVIDGLRREMSAVAAAVRDIDAIERLSAEIEDARASAARQEILTARNIKDVPHVLKAYDSLISQAAVVSAIQKSAQIFGSRGSALVKRSRDETGRNKRRVLEFPAENLMTVTKMNFQGVFTTYSRKVSAIPKPDSWFEKVWKEYRKKRELLFSNKRR